MRVSIYSPRKILYEGEINLINLKTSTGEITILNNHQPLISDLISGVIKIIDVNNQIKYFSISSGFIEVNPLNQIKILVEED